MFVQESYVDATRSVCFGDSGWQEAYTDDLGKLFRSLQREYGRCTGKVYVGDGLQIGWVFQKRMQYEDTGRYGRKPEYYLRDVWVSLSTIDPIANPHAISPWE